MLGIRRSGARYILRYGKKQRDYTFIPTGLFRDYSLIRDFTVKNILNHRLYTLQICKLDVVVNLNALFNCYAVILSVAA